MISIQILSMYLSLPKRSWERILIEFAPNRIRVRGGILTSLTFDDIEQLVNPLDSQMFDAYGASLLMNLSSLHPASIVRIAGTPGVSVELLQQRYSDE